MTFLIDLFIKSTVTLGAAFLIAFALRRDSASVRYAMWTCALAAVLVLPLASLVGPAWNINRSAWRRATTTMQTVQRPSVSVVVQAARPASTPSWPLPVILWIAGATAMLGRVALGHWRIRSLFGAAEEIRDSLAGEIAASIGLRWRVVLKRSTATDVPLSYGIFRATVLLPGESDHWTEERRRIVLSHEMIHARRLDSLWGLLGQLAVAMYWFHPLAWLAAARMKSEQERSCDDAVVAAGNASTVYAAHLVDVARSIAIPEPALGMADGFDLEGRVHALLDPLRNRRAVSRKLCVAMFAGALVLMVPLAAIRAQSPGKASVSGVVYDPSGAIVPGATISLKNIGGSNEEVARGNVVGKYRLDGIAPGQYLVKVSKPGFAIYQKTISIEAGMAATAKVNLAIGDVSEAVEIVGKRAGSAPRPAVTPQRIRVGGNVQPIKLISKVNPDYPADAQSEGVEGTVVLRAMVSKDGSLLSIVPVSNSVDPRLVSAAMAAVPLWRYQPTLLNGVPIEVVTTIDVTFRLN